MRHMPAMKIGDPATVYVGSDRYLYFVVAISPNGNRVYIQHERLGNETATRRRDCVYRIKGTHQLVKFGENNPHMDPSF